MLLQLTALLVLGLLPNGTVDDLKKGAVVRLALGEKESIIGEVLESNDESVTCLDLETLEPVEIARSEIKAVREDVTDALIFQRAGVGRWLGWQLSKQFEDASKPQTIASIQQASVFVTVNRSSGIMVGDEVFVFRIGEPIKDPNTGEILDTPEQKIAQMNVIEASEKLITCRPSGEFTIELRVGDLVRPAVPRSNVAVLPFTNSNGNATKSGVFFSNDVSNALTNLSVDTLERDKLVSILGEQLLQFNLRNGDATRIGKLLGAATLVTGTIAERPSEPKSSVVSVRLLDVRTGQVISTLEAEVPTKDLDRGPVDRSAFLAVTPARGTENSYVAIKSFNEGRRSTTFTLAPDARKIEVSFDVRLNGNRRSVRIPGHKGKLLVNSTIVVQYIGERTHMVNGKRRSFDVYKFHDGTELKSDNLQALPGKIDITQFVKPGEANTLTYAHEARIDPDVRIWVTK